MYVFVYESCVYLFVEVFITRPAAIPIQRPRTVPIKQISFQEPGESREVPAEEPEEEAPDVLPPKLGCLVDVCSFKPTARIKTTLERCKHYFKPAEFKDVNCKPRKT